MESLRKRTGTLVYAILFLFFFQLVADFIEAIYAFGLLGTSVPVEMVSLVVFFSPLVLFVFRKQFPGWGLLLLGQGVLASRVVEVMLDTRGRMVVSGLGVGCFLGFFPALLCVRGWKRPSSSTLGASMGLGLVLSMLFRVLGSGYDISTHRGFQAIGWALAVVASILLFAARAREHGPEDRENSVGSGRPEAGRVVGLALGVTSVWILLYFCFTAPNVIARWTGASYVMVISLVVLAACTWGLAAAYAPRLFVRLTPRAALSWNALFVLALLGTILVHQIAFPLDASAYPLFEPPVTWLHRVPLCLVLLLFPILFIDCTLLVREIVDLRPTSRMLGASFALSSLFFLVVVLGQVFTTVYDYIPVVGPFFRDKFWLVHLVPGGVLILSVLLVSKKSYGRAWSVGASRFFAVAIVHVGVAVLGAAALTAPRPAVPHVSAVSRLSLRVCTYNIQQGYDASGSKNYAGQLDVLRRVDADVIGLQESDTNRVAGGNADVIRYFADQLNLYSYYGPKTVPGTFGIALLSRYPIENARTFYMYSVGEQTATIAAQIRVGSEVLNVYVTHLGNDGPIVQQEAILSEVEARERVVLMGDFNFRPDSAQYRTTTRALDDAWLLRWPEGVDGRGRRFDRRIDHIFLSPGMTVSDAEYITDPESDHPALAVEIGW